MAGEKPEPKNSELNEQELEKAVGGTSRSKGAGGEGAVGTVLKKKRDDQERCEETNEC